MCRGFVASLRREPVRAMTRGGPLRYDQGAMDGAGEQHARVRKPGPDRPPSQPSTLTERTAADPYARWLGIELLEVRPGYCRAALRLEPHMVNLHGSPHGGAIFSLADFAFGGACNSHGEAAVALTVTIQFHVAARVGQRLVAEAREARQGRRAGFYTMTVTDDRDGTVIATCQAVSLRTDVNRPQ
jgi:acyl-CoA thioesterase